MRLPLIDYLSIVMKSRGESRVVPPAREFAVDFNLFEPVKSVDKPKHTISFLKKLKMLKNNPVLLLSTVADHLKMLNRYKVTQPTRLRHLDIAYRYSYAAILEVYTDFHIKEEFPESEKRRYALVSSIRAIRGLSIGYKLIFQHYYSLPDKLFNAVQNRVQLLAFKVIELSYMEQHLSALRYQKFPEQSWRDCNQLFFAMEKIDLVNKAYLFRGCLHGVEDRISSAENSRFKYANIKQLYIVLHLMGLMDVISWPFPLLNKMETYIYDESANVKLKPDKRVALKTGDLIIYHEQICPPLYERIDMSDQSAFLLDISNFEKRLREKYDQIICDKLQNDVSDSLSIDLSLDVYDEQHLVDKMLNKLHFFSRTEPRQYVNQYSELQLFFGFNNCFRFIRDLENPNFFNNDNSPPKNPAQKTSLTLADNNVRDDKQWYVINESQGGVHLRLQESEYTPTMFIGQLVISNLQQEGENNFNVGYVSRIHRRRSRDVEITIIKIGTHGQCVVIQDEQLKAQGQMIPCVFAKKSSGEEILLIYSKQHIYLGSNLYINWKDESRPLKLGNKCLKLPEIIAFEIKNDSLE